MKNVYIFSCLFFINFTAHCMEKNTQMQCWEDFDYTDFVESSESSCQKYIRDNFEEYKQKQIDFTPDRMDRIVAEGDDKPGTQLYKICTYSKRCGAQWVFSIFDAKTGFAKDGMAHKKGQYPISLRKGI